MAKVKTILKKCKANRFTYYGLDDRFINDFKRLYKYLKKHEDREVNKLNMKLARKELNNSKYPDYVRKYRTMEILAHNFI